MDSVIQAYDIFQDELNRSTESINPLFDRINNWEEESINKIRQMAEKTRLHLQDCLSQKRKIIIKQSESLREEMKHNQESGDFFESNIDLWLEKINQLRKELELAMKIDLIIDENPTEKIDHIIIKSQSDLSSNNEQTSNDTDVVFWLNRRRPAASFFQSFVGNTKLSFDHCTARHIDQHCPVLIRLNILYSSDTHQIRFRIDQKRSRFMFFGILNALVDNNQLALRSPSLHGWISPNLEVIKAREIERSPIQYYFQEQDEIILTLDCSQRQISLKKMASVWNSCIQIDDEVCPNHWMVIVGLFDNNDTVRLLSAT